MRALWSARLVAVVMVVCGGLGLAALVAGAGPASWEVGPLRVDAGLVNLVLLSYIGGLMWLVTRYCLVNLRGQRRLGRFGGLCLAITLALGGMVMAGNLVTLTLWWTASGVAIAGLVGHAEHPSARPASRRVLWWMLASSAALGAGAVVAGLAGLRLDGTETGDELRSGAATVAAALVVTACLIRSALVPFQRWLPETAEAPSPVSALLHAGVVNVAGVVAVLQWPLLRAQPAVLVVLGLVGVATVVWCSLEQRVRPDMKGRLAASTSAQMGWMAIQVGVGLPAAAMLHLMGHGAWKAWHFLRAGGAVARARREPALRHAPAAGEVVTTTALALTPVASGIAFLFTGVLFDHTPGFALLGGLGAMAAVVVGLEAAALERSTAALRRVLAIAGGLVVTAYVVAAAAWDHGLASAATLPHSGGWWTVALTATALGAAVGLAVGAPRLEARSAHPVAALVASTSVAPGTRLAGPVAAAADPAAETTAETAGPTPLSTDEVRTAVGAAARLVGPAWPLRATVAANPLAQLEMMPFDTAMLMAERFYGTSLRPPLGWFVDLYDRGVITPEALREAIAAHPTVTDGRGVEALLQVTRDHADRPATDSGPRTAEGDHDLRTPLAHAHVWTARAWHRAEDTRADLHGPWQLFKAGASHWVYDVSVGCPGAAQLVRSLPDDPAAAVSVLLGQLPASAGDPFSVLVRLLAAGPGWVAHAQWRARRCGTPRPLLELVALRLTLAVLDGGRGLATTSSATSTPDTADDLLSRVWQLALDHSERDRLLGRIAAGRADDLDTAAAGTAPGAGPVSQSVWCIDVRSERFRRNLEQLGDHATYGFAGFFGLLARSSSPDGTAFDQCPVIVSPTVQIELSEKGLGLLPAATRVAGRVVARPGVTFAAAEAAGPAAFLSALTASVAPRQWRWAIDQLAPRSTTARSEVSLRELADPTRGLGLAQRADAAEGMLRAIGLTDRFAPVLLLCAHGSTTENNAYVSAYDCGACGGNPGLANATAMAAVLNDPAVREQLAERGIHLPAGTRVLAAQHDTTTDVVDIVTSTPEDEAAAGLVRADLAAAGGRVTAERLAHLPNAGRARGARDVVARANDWAEPMPEWGLSGCAAIVVGTRDLTRGADLGGRVFLHSYDRDRDTEGAVLGALINAPVVVSQWIAAQYWFSTAASAVLGAGDKTTHNVVGDIGVTTGAHGDLRMGLPWQASFATDPRAGQGLESLHVPSRHLVVIEGDPTAIVGIVKESAGVRDLVTNEWMRLVAVDRGEVLELRPDLRWDTLGRPALEGRVTR